MFHSTAMVPDYDAAVASMAKLFGLWVLEYTESQIPEIGRKGGMTWVGDNSIELGQPLVVGAGADKFVAKTGGGLHSVALQVMDLAATEAHLASKGVHVVARPGAGFFFTDQKDTAGIFVEWNIDEIPEDPRFGKPEQPPLEPLLEVTHQAFIGAVAIDPQGSADRLADVFGTSVTFRHPDSPAGSPRAGVSMGDCTLALYDIADSASAELWGRTITRARTHVMALKVPDLADASRVMADAGVAIVRRDDTQIVLDPAATAEVAVVLVDALLPGDPRL
ncbi:MAG: hypothetical protein JWL70_2257 [Acidimicrobiia bacterium]|nr:hypothetical protein [Acidimicrobiia bacterium]